MSTNNDSTNARTIDNETDPELLRKHLDNTRAQVGNLMTQRNDFRDQANMALSQIDRLKDAVSEAAAALAPVQSMVDVALMLDKMSTDYRAKWEPDQAFDFVSRADAYNGFSRGDLMNMIQRINALVPPMNFGLCNGSPNPNNGRAHHVYHIGNEGSRVIYLGIVKYYMPKTFDYKGFVATLDTISEGAHADEHWMTDENERSFEYRIWFD